MDPAEREAIRTACTDAVRILADLADVLTAIAAAARLARDGIERLERDMVDIAALTDGASTELPQFPQKG
jgi:hypothetical protein